ncbi:MAG TPA: chromosomal replication initiator protein DnaA [Chloroflexota bacterium]|nr:chromosomal replication initiator protein DnaA [Chloroflexota bacterium]
MYVVAAQHSFAREKIERSFRAPVEAALARCAGRTAVQVSFVVGGATPTRGAGTTVPNGRGGAAAGPAGFHPRFTFERFVTGKTNQFACAAARAVADNPALAYNPLYLHGEAGMGKTHLLQAIGQRTQALRPQTRVALTSAGILAAELAGWRDGRPAPPQDHGLDALPERYRAVDVLLIDDVQTLPGSAQGALLQLVAALHEANRQVVITGDQPPRALLSLDERLRSWLQTGLVAGIGAPDFATRLGLLQAKADGLGLVLPPAVRELLARRVQGSMRELEGAVTRIAAAAELAQLPLTVEHVSALLADVLGPAPVASRRRVSCEEVLLAVATTFGVPVEALRARRRDKGIVLPRQVAMYLMREETGASLSEIGAELGGRDHSTIVHGCARVSAALAGDQRLGDYVKAARQLLASGQGAPVMAAPQAAQRQPRAAAGVD